ncbi:tRNA:m(4)X modification enzyme TRM13 homolog [Ruditapes philippinarum]|uniref:tRNA:m(4)X modification enzyme TRM13 homolog n=1 Tax=Ruditapes philippinarum TaxID=129788 RepID=UPI00295B6AC1|nr:tRNA:m(4)X modification enzyme TRM13 homolog [Ruditapes philippinarum]
MKKTRVIKYQVMSEKKPFVKPEPPEGGCHFFVDRKRRYCRFKPTKDSTYCAEHASVFGVDLGRKRIECPYDSKHTCYADKLNHHMKKCPSKPKQMPAYYSAGINSGDDAGETVPDPKVIYFLTFFSYLYEDFETVLTVPIEELQSFIVKVNKLYDEHVGVLEEEILTHECLRDELENHSYGNAALRHRKQQASLIGQMEKLGLLTEGKCFLEMGAGKGQLSHWLHGAVEKYKDIGFVLIDRSHVRNKMDNLHKEEMIMERIKIDIEHLRLGKVPSIESHDRGVVAFGKHLCGPATDLALRCATETLSIEGDNSIENIQQRKRLKSDHRKLGGAVIALCCHHRCVWKPYVGKQFFKQCGLSARDFQIMSSMSSWATCAWKGWSHEKKVGGKSCEATDGLIDNDNKETVKLNEESKSTKADLDYSDEISSRRATDLDSSSNTLEVKVSSSSESQKVDLDDDDEDEHSQEESTTNTGISTKLSQEEREVIGRKCKRLIDLGRVHFLQEHGLKSSLKVYIEEFFTPENVVLVAS